MSPSSRLHVPAAPAVRSRPMRRLWRLALVMGLAAAGIAAAPLTRTPIGASAASHSADQLTSILTRSEPTLARITTDDRRDQADRGAKVIAPLLAVIAALLAVAARWRRSARGV